MNLIERLKVDIGEAIGYAELAGLRYSVKPYSDWVDEGKLMRGSRIDTPEGYQLLANKGMTNIVDLRAEGKGDVGYGALQAGMKQVRRFPLMDNQVPTSKDIAQFLEFVRDGSIPTYVHCEAGIGRTGIMCAAYRVFVQGWTAEQAKDEAVKYGMELENQTDFILTFDAKLGVDALGDT